MRHSASRLLATSLLLMSGCALPIFSRHKQNGESPVAEAAPELEPRDITRKSTTDRTLPEHRASEGDSGPSGRSIPELLAAASRSERDGDHAAARRSCEDVLRLDPDQPDAHFKLAVIADN